VLKLPRSICHINAVKSEPLTQFLDLFCLIPEPANILEHVTSISVTEGDPGRLECTFSGNKPLTSRWIKAGKELKSGRRHKIQNADGSSVLLIPQVEQSDSGEYTFEVSNVAGSSTCEADITILGQFIPKFHIYCYLLFYAYNQPNPFFVLCIL